MATATAASEITDGPVLTLINKRIRNLRKKLNRITQLENQSLSQGKSAIKNKEQEDLLKSKPSIVAAVDELEKFRQPLSVAVDEEINLAVQQRHVTENKNDVENVSKTPEVEENETATMTAPMPELQSVEVVEDLLSLIYFGSMFDVKSRSDFDSIMLTRTHERNCCLTYDYVTDDDANVMLGESDLDLISSMGSLLISRPVNSSFSHQNALQRCVEQAKLWLAKSDQPIDSNSNVTYAALREKLVKIMGSDYLKITPEMKAPADVAAEAAGNYSFHVPQVDNLVTQHEQKEDDVSDFQRNETHDDQSGPIEDHSKQHDSEGDNFIETPAQIDPVETQPSGQDYKEQHVPRRSYHSQRGGGGGSGRNNGGVGGGRRGGFGYGRGGRSGGRGGPYQNGRNQYNDQPGSYYPRNNHGGRGRGGRGSSNGGHGGGYAYNSNASRGEVAESFDH